MHGKKTLTFYETLVTDHVNNFNMPIDCHMKKEENMKIGNLKDILLGQLLDFFLKKTKIVNDNIICDFIMIGT